MIKRTLLISLVFLSVTVSAESLKQTYQQGIKAYKVKDFQKSYKIFKSLFMTNLSDKELNFLLGRSAFEIGNYEIALASFERVQTLDPTHLRNKVEMARTYFVLGMYKDSEVLFKSVLANPNLPSNVRKNLELYMAKIKGAQQTSFNYANISLEYIYDSNVNYGALQDTYTSIFGILPTADKISDYALQVYADFLNVSDIGERNGFALKNKISYFSKDYKNVDSSDMQYIAYTPSLLYSEEKYTTELELSFDMLELDNTNYLKTFSVTQRLNYSHDQRYKSVTYLKLMRKSFTQNQQNNLNSNHYELSYGLQNILSPRSFIQANIIGIRETPSRVNGTPSIYARYDESKLNLIYAKQFSLEYGMQMSMELNQRKYNDYSSILLSVREDKGFNTNLTMNAVIYNGFILNAGASYIKTSSNQALFEYTKHTLSMGISKRF